MGARPAVSTRFHLVLLVSAKPQQSLYCHTRKRVNNFANFAETAVVGCAPYLMSSKERNS